MVDERWAEVDRYASDLLLLPDASLDAAVAAMDAGGLPPIQVSPLQGAFLQILARALRATKVLEIGTLGGYSAIWLGRALPHGGRLVTLEVNSHHAEVARSNVDRAGLSSVVEVRLGPALESLPRLEREGFGPCDLVFIDADKPNTAAYFDWALKLTRTGGMIVVDNVVRQGQLADEGSVDPNVQGMRRLMDRVGAEPRVRATLIQTVGSKGYDGFSLIEVLPPPDGSADRSSQSL